MDQHQFRNVSNLVLVKLKRIWDLIYACIRLLFANLDAENVAHIHLPSDDIKYSSHVSCNVNLYFLFVAGVKCALYEI